MGRVPVRASPLPPRSSPADIPPTHHPTPTHPPQTPTFVLFRGGERVHSHGGINETNLHKYITAHLAEGEEGYGSFVDPDAAAAAAAAASGKVGASSDSESEDDD